jgi:hypothetical protein
VKIQEPYCGLACDFLEMLTCNLMKEVCVKFFVGILFVFFQQVGFAGQYYFGDQQNSFLGRDGWCEYDWYRPPSMVKNKSTLNSGQSIRLQARLQWQDNGVVPLTPGKTGEHAFVAFTQGTINSGAVCPKTGVYGSFLNSARHPMRQALFAYGVGAVLSPHGLGIELWNGDGTAFLWNRANNRCQTGIPSGTIYNSCLSPAKNSGSYITDIQNFSLTKGVYYWIRLQLTGNADGAFGWTKINAELVQDNGFGAIVLQEAQLYFPTNSYFPGETIESTIGRTGGEFPETRYTPSNIKFWAFDYGF